MSRVPLSSRFLLLFTFVVALPYQAWSQVNTRRSVSFGDSLTDNDSLFLLFGTDPLIYGADPFEAVFSQASAPDDTLSNYAVLGSTSADVRDQVFDYAAARLSGGQPSATLISLQAGGNDFLTDEVLLTLATTPPGENDAADALVTQIRRNLFTSLFVLRVLDRRATVVLWTVPDVTLTPYVLSLGLSEQSIQNISLHVERLNKSIRLLGRQRRIAVLDVSRVLTEVSLVPPTIDGITLVPPPALGFAGAVFADPIHPTAVSNGLLANELISTLNEQCRDQIPPLTDAELGQLIWTTP